MAKPSNKPVSKPVVKAPSAKATTKPAASAPNAKSKGPGLTNESPKKGGKLPFERIRGSDDGSALDSAHEAALPPPFGSALPPDAGGLAPLPARSSKQSKRAATPPVPVLPPLPPKPEAPVLPPVSAGTARSQLDSLTAPAVSNAPVVEKKPRRSRTSVATPTPAPSTPIQPPASASGVVVSAPVSTMSFPPFELLQTNVKGRDASAAVELAPLTVVYSPTNRSGKTAVLDGVRLALHGTHPVGSDYASLCSLTADGATPVAVIGRKDGRSALGSYIEAGKKKITHYAQGQYEGLAVDKAFALVSADLNALPSLSEAKLRDALFGRFGHEVTAHEAVLAMPTFLDQLKDGDKRWAALLGPAEGRTTVQRLLDAREGASQEKRDQQAAVRHLEKLVAEQGAAVAAAGIATPDVVAAVEKEIKDADELQKFGNVRFAYEAAKQKLATHQQQLAAAFRPGHDRERQLTDLRNWIAQAESWLAAKTHNVPPSPHAAVRAQLVIGQPCPVCTQAVAALPAQEAPEVTAARTQLAQVREQLRQAEQEQATLRTAEAGLAEAQATIDQLGPTVAKLAAVPAHSKEEVAELSARLTSLRASAGRTKEWHDSQAKQSNAELLVSIYKKLEDELATRLAGLVGDVGAIAAAHARCYLPQGYDVALQVADTQGEPTCRWIVRDTHGLWHPYETCSGVERATARVALACAWAESLPMRVLTLDDEELGGFSDAALLAFVQRLIDTVQSGALTQVILASSRSVFAEVFQREGEGLAARGCKLVLL